MNTNIKTKGKDRRVTRRLLPFYLFTFLLLGLSACGDYLDKLPDDRATVDTEEKVAQFLVSAYPTHMPVYLFELASDNVLDNGSSYNYRASQDLIYRFKDDTYTSNDDPYTLWNNHYLCIAAANNALQAIDNLGGRDAMPGEWAEARLIRAYCMYTLANIFCMAYNKDSADVYLGLPYPLQPETPTTTYERGTQAELYAHINDDIEAALPYVSDTHLSVPKYHFNTQAAYAFAARFNLFYGNYDKAIEYANHVLGSNPSAVLRDWQPLSLASGADDYLNLYIASSLNCNLMMQTAVGYGGRMLTSSGFRRYAHNYEEQWYETIRVGMPWGDGNNSSNNTLWLARKMYQAGGDCQKYIAKQRELFEYTDKVAGSGYPHIVVPVFTGDETLLVRAEAEALKNDSAAAIRDINYWTVSHCNAQQGTYTRPTFTMSLINEFYNSLPYANPNPKTELERSVRKVLHPQGFTVTPGNQENLIQLILQMRRIDTIHDGSRLIDIKRYGIEYSHPVDGEPTIEIKAADPRLAFQLPDDAIANGLTANPR